MAEIRRVVRTLPCAIAIIARKRRGLHPYKNRHAQSLEHKSPNIIYGIRVTQHPYAKMMPRRHPTRRIVFLMSYTVDIHVAVHDSIYREG